MSSHFEIEFQHLQFFLAVARAHSFSRAAEELNLSQSTLSRAVQKLEAIVEQPLFDRRPRDVSLTDAGTVLLGRAEQILALMENTFDELTETREKGRIRLAAIPTIAPFFLPSVLSSFAQAHPEVAVTVREDTTEHVARMCKHGEIDVALVALPMHEKYLEVEPLFEEELFLVLPNGHPLERKRSIKLADVHDQDFVMLDPAHCLSDQIVSFCRRGSVDPITIERTSQLATVQELVALSHGISMIPEMARRLDSSDRRVYRSFSGEIPQRTIAMLTNPYRYESWAIKVFKQHLCDKYARLNRKGRKRKTG